MALWGKRGDAEKAGGVAASREEFGGGGSVLKGGGSPQARQHCLEGLGGCQGRERRASPGASPIAPLEQHLLPKVGRGKRSVAP